ncbi:hypothetical protein ACS0TY_006033 [Phlomoides rotata]
MGDTRRISKTGKSKKLGKMKKKKQVVAADLSSDRGEETQGEDAEVEAYQMSSGDEDYSKGMKNETLEIIGGKIKSKRSRDEKRKKGETTGRETQESDTQSEQAADKSQISKKKKRKNVEKINKIDEVNDKEDAQSEQAEDKVQKSKKKKRKNAEKINKVDEVNEKDDAQSEQAEDKLQKSKKKKRKNAEKINKVDEVNEKDDAQSEQAEDKLQKSKNKKRINAEKINKVDEVNEKDDASEQQIGKSKKAGKMKKKQFVATDISSDKLLEKRGEEKQGDNAEDEVYEMSSGDEDYSKGMKKWITEYHQSRPGLKVLQERVDDFIVAHEAKEEQAKAEKEAQAAEGGWTVVVHHRGRKKTTDAESGVAVGSVAQAAVLDNMGKKKKKEVGLDFYRFQKKEAHRNEIMMLQSKFEQDKKRIQQMRAARKFRPY